jgi:type II secretory pathway predicted ATPase ExeA
MEQDSLIQLAERREQDEAKNIEMQKESLRKKRKQVGPAIDEKLALIQTDNYKTVISACESAYENKKMVGVVGYPGAGKTTALERFYDASNTPTKSEYKNVFYVKMGGSMMAKELFRDILKQTGETFYEISLYELIDLASTKIRRMCRESSGLVIIDEAGKLSQKMLEHLHEFRDLTKPYAGILLAGPEYFHNDLQSLMNKGKKGMAEVYSRITDWISLERPKRSEIQAIVNENGIADEIFVQRCIAKCKDFRMLENMINDFKREKR